jgi:hypothetical protein
MIENIGLFIYLYTILEKLIFAGRFAFFASIVVAGFTLFTAAIFLDANSTTWHATQDRRNTKEAEIKNIRNKILKACAMFGVIGALLVTFIPTREDAKLIAGVVIGVNVAEKTIEAVNKSELVGKVLDIVEKKIDNTLIELDVETQKLKEQK